MKCKYCNDDCKAYRCEECKATIGAACKECHEETSHNRIALPPKPRALRAGELPPRKKGERR
ncbi:MAG: hypothetical protein EBR82_15320 [Caulobacteraceae bacterium]|nr:hypothetical protein [Caulobacteraceae bacterium]